MIDFSEKNITRLIEMSKRMRLSGLDMALSAEKRGSHLGGSFSCIEIIAVLYGEIMHLDAKNPLNPNRDRFIPSKAHCVLAHIPALAEVGYIPYEEIFDFQKDGGRIVGHPQRPDLGFEYSSGSLGMAISVGIGWAIGARERKRPTQVYILMGDGELNEGSVWEAFMSAPQYKLDNLTAIIDRNRLSYDGNTEEVMGLDDLPAKLRAFNWNVIYCDGHSIESLLKAFDSRVSGTPNVIIADTIKGKGVSFMENKPEWHHHRISKEEYELAKREIMGE